MAWEPVSPELALVDPELRLRARAALEHSAAAPRAPQSAVSPASARAERTYPFWARVTAALWLLVLGILIGGAAVPHAQEKPRLVPRSEDATICMPKSNTPQVLPDRPFEHGP
jgi:hypothetical protein